MLNRIILEGRLGADPERRETPNGRVVTRLSLPLFNPFKKDSDPTEWVQCEVWNQPAEFITKYGKKGYLVSVDGRLRSQRYVDKDGNTRYNTYISVDRLTLLEPRNRTENNNSTQTNSNTSTAANNNASNQNSTSNDSFPDNPISVGNDILNPSEGSTSSIDELFKDFDGIMNG